jgi:hypothetical protein
MFELLVVMLLALLVASLVGLVAACRRLEARR